MRTTGVAKHVVGLTAVLLITTSCGGGGGGGAAPTAPTPGPPTIANLVATFTGESCAPLIGLARISERLTLDYTDPDGNVSGGQVQVTNAAIFNGAPANFTANVPSVPVTITGTTSGRITVSLCTRFEDRTSLTQTVVLVDQAGNRSNELSVTVTKPPGAP